MNVRLRARHLELEDDKEEGVTYAYGTLTYREDLKRWVLSYNDDVEHVQYVALEIWVSYFNARFASVPELRAIFNRDSFQTEDGTQIPLSMVFA